MITRKLDGAKSPNTFVFQIFEDFYAFEKAHIFFSSFAVRETLKGIS